MDRFLERYWARECTLYLRSEKCRHAVWPSSFSSPSPLLIAYPISLLPRGLPFGIVPSSFICLKDPFVHSSSSCFTCKILYAFSTPFFNPPTLFGACEWCQSFRRWNDDNEIFGFDDTEVNFSRTEFDTSYIEGDSAHWIDVSTYLILSISMVDIWSNTEAHEES